MPQQISLWRRFTNVAKDLQQRFKKRCQNNAHLRFGSIAVVTNAARRPSLQTEVFTSSHQNRRYRLTSADLQRQFFDLQQWIKVDFFVVIIDSFVVYFSALILGRPRGKWEFDLVYLEGLELFFFVYGQVGQEMPHPSKSIVISLFQKAKKNLLYNPYTLSSNQLTNQLELDGEKPQQPTTRNMCMEPFITAKRGI